MDESDIYYVDTRNADNRDHRTQGSGGSPWFRPTQAPVRAVIAQPARAFAQPGPQAVIYGNPYVAPQPPTVSLLGRITGGQLVDLVAQIFAALMPLPAAPVATSDAATDVGNLILYQGSLAQYAKRDEQVRTLGNLITKLLG
jgi:hypothetical protein